jgi:hypothetical protein
MNLRFNAVPQELAGGNMSPMQQDRRTEGSRNSETQYRKAPGGCRESCFNSQAPRRR